MKKPIKIGIKIIKELRKISEDIKSKLEKDIICPRG
jgi:hypothetical protein